MVLILVLMEDALREMKDKDTGEWLFVVLILVLMEDALREEPEKAPAKSSKPS